MILLMTTGACPLGLDRQMVTKLDNQWYEKNLLIWRRLKTKPDIDLDFTQRWFGYSAMTMESINDAR